ncbi:MAG: hypothetical protein WKF31_08935 [Thermoleophilaceae bacterium]
MPIALVYAAAHYMTLLIFQGQALGYLASDPLGCGWNLFGTAELAIDYTVIGAAAVWYLQVAMVVARTRGRADPRPRPCPRRSTTGRGAWPCARSTGCSA